MYNLGEIKKYTAINKRTIGITKDRISVSINCTITVPITAPIKADFISGIFSDKLILFFLMRIKVAVAVPMLPCNLFVPSAAKGGIPLKIRAGIEINPPPPAKVSNSPATIAITNKRDNNSIEKPAKST